MNSRVLLTMLLLILGLHLSPSKVAPPIHGPCYNLNDSVVQTDSPYERSQKGFDFLGFGQSISERSLSALRPQQHAAAPAGMLLSRQSGGQSLRNSDSVPSYPGSLHLCGQNSPWQPLTHSPPFNASTSLLLTDGTVLCQENLTNRWWKLTPDAFGSYVNGTWSQAASMAPDYGPLYYASAVLADGRVVVIGGEYNFGILNWTNQGAIYDPVADSWANLPAPSGWNNIGDAQCCVLPDGTFLLANPFDTRMALLDPATLKWSARTGQSKADRYDEEGWTLLPGGFILTINAIAAPGAQMYLSWQDTWFNIANTPVNLVDAPSQEIGPAVLRPDGTVFAFGATGHNASYFYSNGTWTVQPDFPLNAAGQQLDIADGPACLLPSGNILCMASPGVFQAPSSFFEVDFHTNQILPVMDTPNAPFEPSFVGRMLMLPTGQVLLTDGTNDVEIYTPGGTYDPSWQPIIYGCPEQVVLGHNYLLRGFQFNGLSQASAYGDDASQATNYPLVRITNNATKHVTYCRTFNHSNMGVATGQIPVSTHFTVPESTEPGPSTLEVVANGIPCVKSRNVLVQNPLKSISVQPIGVYGGYSATGTVTLSSPAPNGGTTIDLSSSNPALVGVPAQVTVAANNTSANFQITTVPVHGIVSLTISAQFHSTTVKTPFFIYGASVASLQIVPSTVAGGAQATGTVNFDLPASPNGALVTLSSSDPSLASVPAFVFMKANQTAASFTITTYPVTTTQKATISASFNGTTASATITIVLPSLVSLSLNPNDADGGDTVTGTVALNAPAVTDVTVNLNSNSAYAPVPTSVTIPANSTTATFTVNTTSVPWQNDPAIATISGTYGTTTLKAKLTLHAKDPVPFYRYFHLAALDHFYTTNLDEGTNIAVGLLGYVSEGIACHVYPKQRPGTIPLYRYYTSFGVDHFYTTSLDEGTNIAVGLNGYVSEGIACYVYHDQVPGTVPLYRYYNASGVDHFYTTDKSEGDFAVQNYGYAYEGIECYVFP